MVTTGVDSFLEDTLAAIDAGEVHAAMGRLCRALADVRCHVSGSEWQRIGAALRSHRLHSLLLQSPFTRRAFEKPRGYPGDAMLIDLVYGCGERPRIDSGLGYALYSWEFDTPGCRSVRHRRVRLAREIDAVADQHGTASVLAVACGHLREIEMSVACREGRVSITALDQDPESVALVRREHAAAVVEARLGTVLSIIRRGLGRSDYALAYAAGLYDYLDAPVATALTAALFSSLKSRGRLLLANFTPDNQDTGYMEASMDWHLIYRDEEQMLQMLRRVPSSQIADMEQFRDPEGNITYLRVIRR